MKRTIAHGHLVKKQSTITTQLHLAQPIQSSNLRPHKSKSSLELINSLAVFKACSIPALVNNSDKILDIFEKFKLTPISNFIIKRTFFKHFCGGENLNEVLPTMQKLNKSRVNSILDLSMEADLEAGAEKSLSSAVSEAEKIIEMFKSSIDISSTQPNAFIAVKVTALFPPLILLRWSNTLQVFKSKFMNKNTFTSTEFVNAIGGDKALSMKIFNTLKKNSDGSVDVTSITESIDVIYKESRGILPMQHNSPAASRSDFELLRNEDLEVIDAIVPKIESLCKYSLSKKIRLMIDAEQTYFQHAVDSVALHCSRTINPKNEGGLAVVYNTYQLYLKDGLKRLKIDVERAERFGYTFGVKIVRGAYMVSERERAEELKIEDPINENIEKTHKDYNEAIEYLLKKVKFNPNISFVIASHNKTSVETALRLIKELDINLEEKKNHFGFGQLMGMQDGIAFYLGEIGLSVFKYIPYGPVNITIPYLIRRAQENSSLMTNSGAVQDRKELLEELKIRFGISV
ncbi:hypothetical protein HK099_001259 [Clydaea vesicula]|uniref:Proline dehydrogenase n=1 Tax=Clydaea vesicula TaxID=447962 RepID=A0AAD5TTU7_9FUNG|nr:hypothetical protein HK099_001259 [Clydaea vesicula]